MGKSIACERRHGAAGVGVGSAIFDRPWQPSRARWRRVRLAWGREEAAAVAGEQAACDVEVSSPGGGRPNLDEVAQDLVDLERVGDDDEELDLVVRADERMFAVDLGDQRAQEEEARGRKPRTFNPNLTSGRPRARRSCERSNLRGRPTPELLINVN